MDYDDKMDEIISNRNYEIAKKYIEDNIDKFYLSEEAKNRLTECYNSLTTENAKTLYNEVLNICSNASGTYYRNNKREFNWYMLKLSATICLTGVIPCVLSEVARKYISPERTQVHSFIDIISKCGVCVFVVGFAMAFAIGH